MSQRAGADVPDGGRCQLGASSRHRPLKRLFEAKHRIRREQFRELDPKDLDTLDEIAQTDARPQRVRVALRALGELKPKRALRSARKLLGAPRSTPDVRGVAALTIARLDAKGAEKALIASVRTQYSPAYALRVVQTLARIGSGASYELLDELGSASLDDGFSRHIGFARMLVSLRDRSDRFVPPTPSANAILRPRITTKQVATIEPAAPRLLKTLTTELGLDRFGIELRTDYGARWKCAKIPFLFSANAGIGRKDPISDVLKRPAIIGLILQQALVDDSWSTRYVVTSQPAGKRSIELAGYRTDGRMAFFGRGTAKGGEGQFTMAAIGDGANAPMQMEGAVRNGEIQFVEIVTDLRVVGRKTPSKGVVLR